MSRILKRCVEVLFVESVNSRIKALSRLSLHMERTYAGTRLLDLRDSKPKEWTFYPYYYRMNCSNSPRQLLNSCMDHSRII